MVTYKDAERKIYQALDENSINPDGLLKTQEHDAVQLAYGLLAKVSANPDAPLTKGDEKILREFEENLQQLPQNTESGLESYLDD